MLGDYRSRGTSLRGLLKAAGRISYQREADAGTSEDTRYYICSYPAEAAELLWATRGHWDTENSLHWCWTWPSMRTAAGSERGTPTGTCQWARRLTLNLLKREQSVRVGIQAKRKKAGWDYDCLLRVLSN